MISAFNMAERYQMPVLFLTDQSLSARVESVDRHLFQTQALQERVQPQSKGELVGVGQGTSESSFSRYMYTDNGISPMSVPGAGALAYTATGLEHDEHGHPDYEPEDHTAMMQKRYRKLETAAEELPAPTRYGDDDALVGIIGWGSTEGAIQEAVDHARANGYKVAALHPRILSPLPDATIREFIASVRKVIIPENNYSGQLANVLGAKYGLQAIRVNKFGGIPFTAADIYKAIEEVHP
jgi:2-oxoglutarate ferredoxin oxidoreductase subunit alpha